MRVKRASLRGSEARTLAAVGAFRVVDVSDLRDHHGRAVDPRNGDLWTLREQGLVKTMPLHGRGSAVVTLSDRGRDLLEASRGGREQSGRQTFYAGYSNGGDETRMHAYASPARSTRASTAAFATSAS